MAKFDIQYADRPVDIQATAAMTKPATSEYEALARVGQSIANIGAKRLDQARREKKAEDKLKAYTETENGKIALSKYDAETAATLMGMTDPDEIQKVSEERLAERANLYTNFATTPKSTADLDIYTRKTAVNQVEGINKIRHVKQQEKAYVAYDVMYTNLADEGGFDLMADASLEAFNNGVIDGKEYARRLKEIPEKQHDWNVEQVRELTQAMITEGKSKDEAYELINIAQENELITAEDNKILGDSLDNFVSGRIKKAKDDQYQQTVDTYNDFTSMIQSSDLTYEVIGKSPLLKKDKEKWATYIKGQNLPQPNEVVPEGFNAALDVAVRVSTLEMSEQEAVDILMEERYVNRTINDETLAWAIDKIENPYPKHFTPDIKATIKSNATGYNSVWLPKSKDKVKAQNVNSMLISWVDNQIAEGKYPSAKELYLQSEHFRSIASTKYAIGDVLERNKKSYQVIDFDIDGEPIIEVIQ